LSDKDQIKELFQSKLGNLETPVNPSVWAGIQSQLPAAGSVSTGGLSLLSKVIIGISSAAVITTATIIALNSEQKTNTKKEVLLSNEPKTEAIVKKDVQEDISAPDVSVNTTEKSTNHASDQTTQVGFDELNGDEEFESQEYVPQERKLPVDLSNDRLAKEDDPYQKQTDPEKEQAGVSSTPEKQENKEEKEAAQETLSQKPEPTKIDLKNIFTPNGDFDNDELFLDDYGLKDFNLVVLNSRNEVVYQTNDPNFRWNGTDMKGVPVPDGNYIYMVTAYDANDLFVKASSMLKIVR